MTNWPKIKLLSLCNRIGDGLHGTPDYKVNGDVYFINGNNLKGGKIIVDIDTKMVSGEEFKKNFIPLNKNTLLIGINGSLGNMAFYNGEQVMLGKSSAYINFKSDVNKFYYYYFQLPEIQKYFYDVATGSTIKNLSLKSLQEFEVPLPSKTEYRQIATVLSALDDKIELNNKINSELEAMAKTLYDYWFVQFDFPNAEGKPYKSSGGEMVYDEVLKREIPKGWEVKSLGEYCKIKKGTLITEKTANLSGDVKVISAGLNYSYLHSISNYPKNTITISASGANAGYVNFWRESIFACDCTTVRSDSDVKTIYILNFLKSVQGYIYSQARGSAQPHVYPKDIEQIFIVVPKNSLLSKIEQVFVSSNDKITTNLQQNQELASLRDWLLPMLMNGQVRVVEGYKEFEVLNIAAEPEVGYGSK